VLVVHAKGSSKRFEGRSIGSDDVASLELPSFHQVKAASAYSAALASSAMTTIWRLSMVTTDKPLASLTSHVLTTAGPSQRSSRLNLAPPRRSRMHPSRRNHGQFSGVSRNSQFSTIPSRIAPSTLVIENDIANNTPSNNHSDRNHALINQISRQHHQTTNSPNPTSPPSLFLDNSKLIIE
jgi:hypothetical protein